MGFNEDALTLEFYEVLQNSNKQWLYEVDLERCAAPAHVLDWIMHVSQKTWASDLVLASLVRDLYLYLGPNVCFGPGSTNVRALVRKQMTEANILRGKRPIRSSNRTGKQSPPSAV